MFRAPLLMCLTAVTLSLAAPAAVRAAAESDSGLKESCSYRFGVGDYQSVSYDGHTSCEEAEVLIGNATRNGKAKPKVGVKKVGTPHGRWRCVTVRRREGHGVIESTHRTTCSLANDPKDRAARIRFFYES